MVTLARSASLSARVSPATPPPTTSTSAVIGCDMGRAGAAKHAWNEFYVILSPVHIEPLGPGRPRTAVPGRNDDKLFRPEKPNFDRVKRSLRDGIRAHAPGREGRP